MGRIALVAYQMGEMMPDYAVNTPDTVQCALYWELDTRLCLTSLTFRHNGGPPVAADASLLAEQMAEYYILRVLPLLSDELRFDFAIVVPLNGDFSLIRGSTNDFANGGVHNPSMPNNVGFRLELRTALTGRAYMGWNTFCGLPRVVVLKNAVSQIWADDLVSQWVGIGPLANALGWEWVVTSNELAGAPRTEGITTPITTVSYKDLVIDSARHRIPTRRF